MTAHTTTPLWLRRMLAALLVLCVLVLHAKAPAAVAEDAAESATWLVLQAGADAPDEPSAAMPAPHAQGHAGEQDPPCWGDVIEAVPACPTPAWLNHAQPCGMCPPLQPALLPTPERPPRA